MLRRTLLVCAASLLAAGCLRVNANAVDMSPPDPIGPGDLGGGATELVGGAALQSVAGDQSLLAYLTGVSASNGVEVGRLTVASLPAGGAATQISDDAWAAGFGGTATLLYLTGPTPSTDSGSTAVYGTWAMWKPGQKAGIHLSTGLALARAAPPSNAWAMYWDVATPSLAATGAIRLARIGDCSATACAPVTIAPSVARVVAMSASPDGRFAAYSVKLRTTPATYDVYLVTEATGAAVRIAASASGASTSFSPDGDRFATVGAGGALVVVDSATAEPAAWAAMPGGARTQQVAFADPETLLVRAVPADATAGDVYLSTAAATTILAADVATMEVPRNNSSPSGRARFAFVTSALSGGVGPVVGYDLDAVTPAPIPIATAASTASVAVSSDQAYVRVLDGFDPATQTGTLVAVSLPDGARSAIADGVGLGAPAFAGPHTLFFIDGSDRLRAWIEDAVITYAGGVDQYRLRGASLYFGVRAADAVHGYVPGVYVTSQ